MHYTPVCANVFSSSSRILHQVRALPLKSCFADKIFQKSSRGNKSRNGNNSGNARDCGSRCSSSLATCLLQQGLIFVAKDMLLTMRSNENHNSRHSSSYFHSSIYFLCWRWPSADFKIPLYSHSLTRRYFVQ